MIEEKQRRKKHLGRRELKRNFKGGSIGGVNMKRHWKRKASRGVGPGRLKRESFNRKGWLEKK